jgi:hypothetical protein
MLVSPIQILLILFLLFAISRVVLRHKDGNLTLGEFLFWFGLFAFALIGVVEPAFTSYVAQTLGIGRGADVVVYASIALLFYLIFRTNIHLEETRHEITKLVRLIALNQKETKSKK